MDKLTALLGFIAYGIYGVESPSLGQAHLSDTDTDLYSLFEKEFNSYLPSIQNAGLDMYKQEDALQLITHCAKVVGYEGFKI